MTPRALAAPPARAVRDALPAGLAGLALRSPVRLLLIAASAVGFRFAARR